ncbi:acetate/propionate family kinase [Lentzea albida]|uniref:Acetate kinase n=1 Tax=Lentzea albida TaxID=65499 RepID=A0A1H9RC93_9PSEU|nr:acetate/propionate family kinase [Lentzea albida]SER70366.1 acetate kinase [Lentzea albida]
MSSSGHVLVVNAGSSSLKLTVLGEDDSVLAEHHAERWHGETDPLERFLTRAPGIRAVGHRVVHGGPGFTGAQRIDAGVRAALEQLTGLAPLHQPRALAGIDAVTAVLPRVPQVACFDTAFHATMPAFAATYALPAQWRREWGLRRYGFHGLSHAYASRKAAELAGMADARVVSCHLGAGASLAAVRGGRSVDTTMGFTPLAGLVMATRSGDVDPGLLVWLLRAGVSLDELEDGLEHRSGLAGLAGTGDMRDVRRAADGGDQDAVLALEVYAHRLRQAISAMTTSLGGIDVLVFTGGVGEHDAVLRDDVVNGLSFLGIEHVHVVRAREDLEIASQTRAALAG